MAKLLDTRLPLALTDVDADTFNRLVRILEINLGKFDPSATPQFNDSDITTLAFNQGDVIWNTSIGVLQVYDGIEWIQLHTPINKQGYEAQALVGSVTIKIAGSITISLGSDKEYWGIEKLYT